jgi:hypothetical protein
MGRFCVLGCVASELCLGDFVVMPDICEPDCAGLCDREQLRLTDFVVSHWILCGSDRIGLSCSFRLCLFASLLWSWTMCGPVQTELCACVFMSFQSAFANRWGRELGEGEREIEAPVGTSAWGRGARFHILFQIMMYSRASVSLDGQIEPSRRLLCPEACRCPGV